MASDVGCYVDYITGASDDKFLRLIRAEYKDATFPDKLNKVGSIRLYKSYAEPFCYSRKSKFVFENKEDISYKINSVSCSFSL